MPTSRESASRGPAVDGSTRAVKIGAPVSEVHDQPDDQPTISANRQAAALAMIVRRHRRELDLAAATYASYLERTPEDGEAWVGLGVIYSDVGDFESAYDAFDKATKVDYDHEEVYYNWAITAVRNQDVEQVQRCIEALQDASRRSR